MENETAVVEAFAAQVYVDMNQIWIAKKNAFPTWELGFRILYSPPILKPELVIVGENPGCLRGQVFALEEHSGWPGHNEYAVQGWPLASKLRILFSAIGLQKVLERSVGLNANFFRSHSSSSDQVGLRWKDNPPTIRRELESICLEKVFGLISAMNPKIVLALGMKAFDALTRHNGTIIIRRGRDRLCAIGNANATTIIGIIHPTGAQVSNDDWARVMPHVHRQFTN